MFYNKSGHKLNESSSNTMATQTETITTPVSKLELRTAYGPVYRDVLDTPPRDCTSDEIPVIDLSGIFSPNLDDRKAVAAQVNSAGVNTGFFYIKNHGISSDIVNKARRQVDAFFKQPEEAKLSLAKGQSKYFNGYSPPRTTLINRGDKIDTRESLSWRYSPENDPEHPQPLESLPEEVKPWIRGEDFVWERTAHLPGFKDDVLGYWQACLLLARKLARTFALALDLPEDYFDSRTTYPGADGVFNYYPVPSPEELQDDAVGLGSHTDLQLFTLLWQDQNGGLQVLNKDGQWIKAKPIPDTFVVNIGVSSLEDPVWADSDRFFLRTS